MFIKYKNRIGRKFLNFVFRNRLGKSVLATRLIILIMGFFDKKQVYINTRKVNNFDHYVPKLLLNRWRISEQGELRGKIFTWSKSDGKIKAEYINRVAGEINWDTISANGEPSDYVSRKLYAETLEQKASHIIKYINNNNDLKLTFIEENTLSVFVAHQIVRVPHFRNSIIKFLSLAYSKGLIEIEEFSDKATLLSKVVHNSIKITCEQLNNESPNKILHGAKQQVLALSLSIANEMAKKLYSTRQLRFITIPEDSKCKFVISDNPVVIFDVDEDRIYDHIPWWEIETKKFIFLMPISPTKALAYIMKGGTSELSDQILMKILNLGQYRNCTNKVFANEEAAFE